jgi:hypothetical protein
MGEVRARDYDAVIGVGGIGSEAQSHGIAGRINWVGIGAKKHWGPDSQRIDPRGPIVQFEKFRLWENNGPLLHVEAPLLARRFYEKGARWIINGLSHQEFEQALAILKLVDDCKELTFSSTATPPAEQKQGSATSNSTELCSRACPPSKVAAKRVVDADLRNDRCRDTCS